MTDPLPHPHPDRPAPSNSSNPQQPPLGPRRQRRDPAPLAYLRDPVALVEPCRSRAQRPLRLVPLGGHGPEPCVKVRLPGFTT